MKIYVAINKETGELMPGASGQYAYGSKASLAKSIGQDWWTRKKAREKGVRPRDLYEIYELDLEKTLELAGRKID